jgi:hypothetical protein
VTYSEATKLPLCAPTSCPESKREKIPEQSKYGVRWKTDGVHHAAVKVTEAKAAVRQAVCLPRRTVAISDVGGSDMALTVSGLVSDAATATGNQSSVSTASRSTVSGSARFSAWHLSVGCQENKGKSK